MVLEHPERVQVLGDLRPRRSQAKPGEAVLDVYLAAARRAGPASLAPARSQSSCGPTFSLPSKALGSPVSAGGDVLVIAC